MKRLTTTLLVLIVLVVSAPPVAPADDCALSGIPLFGKVQFVDVFPDLTIQFVDVFAGEGPESGAGGGVQFGDNARGEVRVESDDELLDAAPDQAGFRCVQPGSLPHG